MTTITHVKIFHVQWNQITYLASCRFSTLFKNALYRILCFGVIFDKFSPSLLRSRSIISSEVFPCKSGSKVVDVAVGKFISVYNIRVNLLLTDILNVNEKKTSQKFCFYSWSFFDWFLEMWNRILIWQKWVHSNF